MAIELRLRIGALKQQAKTPKRAKRVHLQGIEHHVSLHLWTLDVCFEQLHFLHVSE